MSSPEYKALLSPHSVTQSSAREVSPVGLSEGLFPNMNMLHHSRSTTGVRTQLSEKDWEGLVKRNE